VTPERRKKVIAGMLVADLLVFGGWIASLQASLLGDRMKLPVEGFDPRDLISGHYVRFRLTAEREASALLSAEERVRGERLSFCMEPAGGRLHPVRVRKAGDACKPILTGQASAEGVRFGPDRFYVDERRANEVAAVRAGPDTYLLGTIDDGGRVHPIDLVVDGKSLGRRK
jgi:uncharacterized membrane-anchored protein